MRFIRFFVIFIAVALFACSRGGNEKFEEIDALCDSDPRLAISMLDSIDYGSLSTPDRHRYDLLSIKSRDKAYVRHTSDSLILDVIDYYQEHQKLGFYPEALYYAARVYSDIGDLPTALSYFYKTIDTTPDDRMHTRFKSFVFNQTGRILHSLQLDSAAIDYLRRSLSIEEEADNAYGIAFTHKLLSKAYLNMHDMERASQHIQLALHNSSVLPRNDRSSILIDSAVILAQKGQNDSALAVIRAIPLPIDSLDLPLFLAVAAETYREVGIIDTAYRYARQLISLPTPENKITGYKVILSERVRDRFSKDSLVSLVCEYKESIESYMNRHEGDNAIIQHTRYNYDVHERERSKAEKKLYVYAVIASIAVIVSLILLAVILYRKFRKADTEAGIATAINILKESPAMPIEQRKSKNTKVPENEDQVETPSKDEYNVQDDAEKIADIKKRIMARIRTSDEKDINSLVNPAILASPIYSNLKERTESKRSITNPEDIAVYKGLEELIESVSSGFSYRLRILTEDRITASERKMALLMKCGFSPLQISILFGREKNTISTHRRNLAFKITGQKKASQSLDLIIISI